MKAWYGKVLLGVQLVCMLFIPLTGYWFASPTWIWFEMLGIALGAWSLATMKPKYMHPLPEPRKDARLVTSGPYRWLRHPMYTAVLVATLALVIDHPTPVRWIAWLILLADLVVKLEYEETLLARRFADYAAYRQRTKRLIPFVY
jgi:protein-S-isoprenylcysteine O-methyltransferase Ste14